MKQYTAIINVPGYMPMADEPATFDNVTDAWQYLVDERQRSEDDYADDADELNSSYSATVNVMESLTTGTIAAYENAGIDPLTGLGTIYGATPGYEGDHDLGLAYSVVEVEQEA